MSVYGGFATRKQEAFYNKLIAKGLQLITQKVLAQVPYHEVSQFLHGAPPGFTQGSPNQSKFDDDGTGSTSTDGVLYEMGMNRDQHMHDEMRKNPSTLIDSNQPQIQQSLPQQPLTDQSFETANNLSVQNSVHMEQNQLKMQNLQQLSYISESNGVPNPMSLNSNTNGYFNTMPAAAVYMRFDERKWATTLVKVYRHMRLLERSKYLEPFFSQYFSPLVKYAASKHKLSSAPLSNFSAGQPALPSHKILTKIPGMDVVYEEDDPDPLKRGTTPNKKSTHRSMKNNKGGDTSDRFRRNTAQSNEGSRKSSRNTHAGGSRSSRESKEYQQQPIYSTKSRVKQELFKTQNSSKERKQESNIMIIQGGQSIHELPNNLQMSSSRKEDAQQQLTPNLTSQYYQGFRDESSPLTTNLEQQQPSPLNANYSQLTLNSNTQQNNGGGKSSNFHPSSTFGGQQSTGEKYLQKHMLPQSTNHSCINDRQSVFSEDQKSDKNYINSQLYNQEKNVAMVGISQKDRPKTTYHPVANVNSYKNPFTNVGIQNISPLSSNQNGKKQQMVFQFANIKNNISNDFSNYFNQFPQPAHHYALPSDQNYQSFINSGASQRTSTRGGPATSSNIANVQSSLGGGANKRGQQSISTQRNSKKQNHGQQKVGGGDMAVQSKKAQQLIFNPQFLQGLLPGLNSGMIKVSKRSNPRQQRVNNPQSVNETQDHLISNSGVGANYVNDSFAGNNSNLFEMQQNSEEFFADQFGGGEEKIQMLKHQADRLKKAVTKNASNSRETLARTPVTRVHTDKLGQTSSNTREFKRRNNNGVAIYHHSNNSASKPAGEDGNGKEVVRGMIRHIMRTNEFQMASAGVKATQNTRQHQNAIHRRASSNERLQSQNNHILGPLINYRPGEEEGQIENIRKL